MCEGCRFKLTANTMLCAITRTHCFFKIIENQQYNIIKFQLFVAQLHPFVVVYKRLKSAIPQ